MEHFVISGTGRCGTKFLSRLLSKAGVECGHEEVFNFDTLGRPLDWEGLVADASWMSLPFLPVNNTPVVTITRHPLMTVKSFVRIGFYGGQVGINPCHKVVESYAPEIYEVEGIEDRTLLAWTIWTEAIISHAELRFKLEEFSGSSLARIIRWSGRDGSKAEEAFRELSPLNANPLLYDQGRWGVKYKPGWDQHRVDIRNRAMKLAKLIGYEV